MVIKLDDRVESSGEVNIGLFATCDPRIDEESKERARNIVRNMAEKLDRKIMFPDGSCATICFTEVLLEGEQQADMIANMFINNKVNVLVCLPDTWAFPQPTLLSLLSHFPKDTPLNITCGNSAPKPGVVYTHASSGALAQSGRLVHINVGKWPDVGINPVADEVTLEDLIDWLYAASTYQVLKGKRVVIFGHDSMGMETALAHVVPTRNKFGLEITRLDMKLVADMLGKKAWDESELKEMKSFLFKHCKENIELKSADDEEKFEICLSMYLVVKRILEELNAVGGGFMAQLEWGSDLRGIPLPVPDIMESFFNSTFDHRGRKAPLPFATEADVQGLLTMLFFTYLSGGNPPLFMDFRKVWEKDEIVELAEELGILMDDDEDWVRKGFVDGVNSGSASLDWAGLPGEDIDVVLSRVSFPLADKYYFPGSGNSVTFVSPGGINGIAGRLAYSYLSDMFVMVWDEAKTVDLPEKLAKKVINLSNPTWPHTFVVPKYASMGEYKQYAPANHLHMIWGLKPKRLEYWMDLSNVLSVTPWKERSEYIENVDRPLPLLYLLNGGENITKILRNKKL